METFTPSMVATLDDPLLAPPRATEPTIAGLLICLDGLAVRIYAWDGPEAYRVMLLPTVPAVAWDRWIGIARRRLEDAGMDVAHREDRSGVPCVAVFRPGTP